MLQQTMAMVGTGSSALYLIVSLLQIKLYGLKGWWRLGMGLGMEVHEARQHLRELEDEVDAVEAAEEMDG